MAFIMQDEIELLENYKFINYDPSEIIIYNDRHEILLEEISLAAVSKENSRILLAIGKEARQVDGNENLTDVAMVGSYLKNGVIAEFRLASSVFCYFLHEIKGRKLFSRPIIAICVPIDLTQVEKQAYTELLYSLGAKKPLIIEDTYKNAAVSIPSEYKIIIEIIP